jgi:hypothetical protein
MGGSGRPPSPQRARRRRSRRRARVAGVQRPRAPQATGAADGAAVALEWPAHSVPERPQASAPPPKPPSRSSAIARRRTPTLATAPAKPWRCSLDRAGARSPPSAPRRARHDALPGESTARRGSARTSAGCPRHPPRHCPQATHSPRRADRQCRPRPGCGWGTSAARPGHAWGRFRARRLDSRGERRRRNAAR